MLTVIATDRAPTPFLMLGAGGLIPFLAGAAALWLAPPDAKAVVREWLAAYGVVILAFVGALHWGIVAQVRQAPAASVWVAAGWGVVPALVAWVALAIDPATTLVVLAGMFALQLAMDRWLARNFPVAGWFLRLRAGLTAVVVAALAAGALA
ncbi:MAG: DUF3429 domain-containing protein [Burkholderiales bacterium]|nr:DUF3429 domain-containing protein [Burkholderiales bacterium]